MIDWSKAEKLPDERRYFNVSVLWIFYYRGVLRLLYYMRIPHEIVTLGSIGLGVLSALYFYQGKILPAAILLHFKDVFDACDGALARLTGRGHLIGRYLDSLGDFLVLTAVVIAIAAQKSSQDTGLIWLIAPLAVLSIFLQCSVFNFYQIAFVERSRGNLSSRQDEITRDDLELESASLWKKIVLQMLHACYLIVFSWQDKLVAAIDNHLYKQCPAVSRDDWFLDKKLMTLQSPLCFGTHIFVIILFSLFRHPEVGLYFIATIMNLYLIGLLYYRRRRMGATPEKLARGMGSS